MGSSTQGFKIRTRPGRKTKTVVFWHPGEKRQVERSTGESDPKRAKARGAQIFAEELAVVREKGDGDQCVAPPLSTDSLAVEWLRTLRKLLDDGTIAAYAQAFESHLVPAFPSLRDVTTTSWRAYVAKRLQTVTAQTVRKELTPMRGLLAWCEETGRLKEIPRLPGVPKRATGTQFKTRRRSKPDSVSPEETRAILDCLPEWSNRLGPVRSRFVLQYEMGLRSKTIDRLSKPEHWNTGSDWLDLPASTLKGRRASRKLLTDRAKEALKEACRGLESGLIFGAHDYREQITAAAEKVLDADRAKRFTATHFRSEAITHLLDAGAPLTAAQTFADHKLATTTDRYVMPSQRALEAELRKLGRVT